ncbi:MAG: peptidoglycan DD-metalloendopeptidase family protein [bacterium]
MRRLSALFLLLIFFSFGQVWAVSEEQKLKNIQNELEANKVKLQKVKKEEEAVLGRLVVINKELSATKSSLSKAQKTIQTNEKQIGTLTSELKETTAELKTKEAKLLDRINEVYKSSSINYFDLLFTSQSLSDFLNRMYFFRRTVEFDATLVNEVQATVAQAQKKKNQLQSKTEQVKKLAVEIAEKKKTIAVKVEEKEQVYAGLKQRRIEYEAEIAELEKSSKELEVLILKRIAASKGSKVLGSGIFAMPTTGRFTSSYGWRRHPIWGGKNFHRGQDIANKYGTPIKAADAGEVIFAGWWDGYGKAIVIDHGRSTTTVYGHMSRLYKQVGDIVAKGQIVGLMGSTGYSTGPHLHFEVRKNGKPVDPMPYLK